MSFAGNTCHVTTAKCSEMDYPGPCCGSAGGQRRQGVLVAPFAAALLAPRASRFASSANRDAKRFKGEANGCFVWVSVAQMTFFGLLASSTLDAETRNTTTTTTEL